MRYLKSMLCLSKSGLLHCRLPSVRASFIQLLVLSLVTWGFATSIFPMTEDEVIEAATEQIQKDGLEGSVHGAVGENEQFVFTWRPDPKEFFVYFDFPLIGNDTKVLQDLKKFKRHDKIKISGKVYRFPAPHIVASAAELIKAYDQDSTTGYERDQKALEELKEKSEAVFQVHVALPEQGMLLLEHKDWVLPYTGLSKDYLKDAKFFRGDLVDVHFVLQGFPEKPVHLKKPRDVQNPIVILDRLVERNGATDTLTGTLVKYVRSPSINRDVYALEFDQGNGFKLNFTLINFDSPDEDKLIQEKLATAWAVGSETAQLGRNKFRNEKIRLKVKGTVNVVDPKQANPQLLIEKAADVEITHL